MTSKVDFAGEIKTAPSKEEAKEEMTAEERRVANRKAASRRVTRGASVAINRYDVNFGIPSRKSVHDFVVLQHGEDDWRVKLHTFLEQSWVEWTLVGLLCCDIVIIFTEMFLMIEYPSCTIIERDCLACCPYEVAADQNERWLAESYCPSGFDVSGEPSCDSHKYDHIHKLETVLFTITLIILCIFFIEISLEMAALGIRKFCTQVFLVLDFFIVTISLIFEIFYYSYKSRLQEVFAVLVVFRIWRFIRVGHALVEVSSEFTSNQFDCMFEYVKECEKLLKASKVEFPEKSKDVHALMEEYEGHVHHYTHGGHHHDHHGHH